MKQYKLLRHTMNGFTATYHSTLEDVIAGVAAMPMDAHLDIEIARNNSLPFEHLITKGIAMSKDMFIKILETLKGVTL